MMLGPITSAILNVCFGFSTAVIWLGTFWMINGLLPGTRLSTLRLLTHWFGFKEMATRMAIWNTSQYRRRGGDSDSLRIPCAARLAALLFVPMAMTIVMAMMC